MKRVIINPTMWAKNKNKDRAKSNEKSIMVLRFVLTVYGILYLLLFKHYQYKLFPDSISYLTITQKYLNADFANAINIYWPPLFSWLLVPFQWLGFSPLISAKVLYFFIGLFTITGINRLFYRFDMSEKIRMILLVALIPIILHFSLTLITPDFLLVCILLYYFDIIFAEDYLKSSRAPVLCGVLGGVAYLCKTYAFPFFLIHFLTLNLIYFFRSVSTEDKKRTARGYLLGMITFSAISGLWIGIISIKSKEITIGTTVKYNLALTGPNSADLSLGTKGFVPPPNNTAVAAWEDPSAQTIQSWSPMQSMENLKHGLRHVNENAHYLVTMFLEISFFSIVILITYVIWCIPIRLSRFRNQVFFPLFTIMLYSSGYLLLWVNDNERYFWIIHVLLLLMGGQLLHLIFRNLSSNAQKLAALGIFALSFGASPFTGLCKGFNEGKEIYALSQQLKSRYKIEGNTASYATYKKPLYLSFYLNCQYHGKVKDGISDEELELSLRANDIHYYFIFSDVPNSPHYVPKFLLTQKEITNGSIPNLKIYAIKENHPKGS